MAVFGSRLIPSDVDPRPARLRNLQAVTKVWHDSEKQRIEKADLAAARQGGG